MKTKEDNDEIGEYRYWLKIPFKKKRKLKSLYVILKNPSTANSLHSDDTVNRVCNVAYKNKYSEVIILSLFPYRSQKAAELVEFFNSSSFKSKMEDNIRIILSMCENNDVVFAWGTNTVSQEKKDIEIYDAAISNIVSSIRNRTYYVEKCGCVNHNNEKAHSNIRYPLHVIRWHKDSVIIQY